MLLVARIRDHLRQELSHLPEYTCLETIDRFHKPPQRGSKMENLDTVRLEVLYSGDQEWYGLPGERTVHQDNPRKLVGSGMIANGPFPLYLRSIFLGREATFKYQGQGFWPDGVRPNLVFICLVY